MKDSFDRHSLTLGDPWRGKVTAGNYTIWNMLEGEALAGGPAYWAEQSYGVNQEACITLTKIDGNGHHTVLLKVQPANNGKPNWKKGVIAVFYNTEGQNQVGVETYVPGQGWITLGSFPMTLSAGDQLSGRALPDGTVEVFVNGVVVGAVNTSFFAGKGGYTGLWFITPGHARFDDFAVR